MSNDNKTLADVQPGGRVRLGDQDLSTSEGARRYVADFFDTQLRRHDFGDYILTELAADFACALAQHLSAQPSPGGQGDTRIPFETWAKDGGFDVSKFKGIYNSLETRAAWEAWLYWQRLAVRQPVTMDDALAAGDGTLHVAIDHWQERALRAEAELAARQPVEFERAIPTRRRESAVELLLQLGFVWDNQRWEDRRQPVGEAERRAPVQGYHGETIPWHVHGLAWEAYAKKYGNRQSAERLAERGGFGVEEMDMFLPGWRDMVEGPAAQAVDLGPLRVLADHAAGRINHANNGLCPDEVEGHDTRDPDCPVCRALIDSQAVGNG